MWALIAAYFFLTLFIIFFLFPPYYMIVTSFNTNQEISSVKGIPWIFNQAPTLFHYKNLLTETFFLTFFKNTIIVTFFSVTISMAISILAAYSLSRMRDKEYAARILIAMEIVTEKKVTIIVFLKKVRKNVSVSRFL